MKTLGLVMIVKNEERSLEKCLAKVKKLVDKIYITDTGSTDKTVAIAKKFGAHVTHFEWCNDFAAARNFALEQSDCDWNLVLDADEYLVKGSRRDIQEFMENGGFVGAIQNNSLYRESTGEISKSYAYITRLIPKGTFFEGAIHEQVVSELPVAPLPLIFNHDGYLEVDKGSRNLEILLEQLDENPEDSYTLYQISRTLWIMKDFQRADEYFEKFYQLVPDIGTGYRANGIINYIYNLLELQKFNEGLALIQREKLRLRDHADFHFACGTFYMKMILSDVQKYIDYLPEIEKSYMRCLAIGEVPEHEGVLGSGSFKAAYNLGVWYEVSGNIEKALLYYKNALNDGYAPAGERIRQLKKG